MIDAIRIIQVAPALSDNEGCGREHVESPYVEQMTGRVINWAGGWTREILASATDRIRNFGLREGGEEVEDLGPTSQCPPHVMGGSQWKLGPNLRMASGLIFPRFH